MTQLKPPSNQRWLLGTSAVGTLLTFSVLSAVDCGLGTRHIHIGPFYALANGVAGFAFAGDPQSSDAVLSSWSPSQRLAVAFSLGFAFLFILAYGTLMTIGWNWAFNVFRDGSRWKSRVGVAILLALIWAASCHVVQNVAMLRQLWSKPVSPWPEIAYWSALNKFGALLLGVGYIAFAAICWWWERRWTASTPSPLETRFDVFLSYARLDCRFQIEGRSVNVPHELKTALELHGRPKAAPAGIAEQFRVCSDKDDLEYEDILLEALKKKIRQSEHFLLLSSSNSARSKWVRLELDSLRDLKPESCPKAAILDSPPDQTFPDIFPRDSFAINLSVTPEMSRREWRRNLRNESHKFVAYVWNVDLKSVIDRWKQERNRRIRRAISLLGICVVAVLCATLWGVHQQSAARRADIELRLAQATYPPLTPTSLAQRTRIEQLRDEAERLGYTAEVEEMKKLIDPLVPASARHFYLPADPDRQSIVLDGNGKTLCISYRARLEVYDLPTGSLSRTIDTSKIPDRAAGKIVWVGRTQTDDRFVFEVEYAPFADPREQARIAYDANQTTVYRVGEMKLSIDGVQRELFSFELDEASAKSVGMCQDLTLHTKYEDYPGEFDQQMPWRRRVNLTTRNHALGIAPDRSKELAVALEKASEETAKRNGKPMPRKGRFNPTLIARDVRGGAEAYRVWEVPEDPTLFATAGSPPQYLEPVLYFLDGRIMKLESQATFQSSDPGSIPNYEPATLDTGPQLVLLDRRLTEFSGAKPRKLGTFPQGPETPVGSVLASGPWVIDFYSDRSIVALDGRETPPQKHKVGVENAAISRLYSTTTQCVMLLRPDRSVEGWKMTAFGEDGKWSQSK